MPLVFCPVINGQKTRAIHRMPLRLLIHASTITLISSWNLPKMEDSHMPQLFRIGPYLILFLVQ